MTEAESCGGWFIFASLLFALMLSVSPMPEFMEVGRPLWPALILTYWALVLPQRVGLVYAWLTGLGVDLMYGTLLGLNALVLSLVVSLIVFFHKRLHRYNLWQQGVFLLAVYSLTQLLLLWLTTLIGPPPSLVSMLLPALVSTLLWPWVFAVMRFLLRRFNVR